MYPVLSLSSFAVNARCSPGRILGSHTVDQGANFFADTPPTRLTLETHVQYRRNPVRCQFTTILGVNNPRGLLHPGQHVLNTTQNNLCRAVNRRRGRCACRASNCCRGAIFSRTRSSRDLKAPTIHPRRSRSNTIMARSLSKKSESSLAPSHSFLGVQRFGEAQGRAESRRLDLARSSAPFQKYGDPYDMEGRGR